MKLNQIRDVVAIADRGSLRSAAQTLGLAQPALTRSIRELERELGVDLFERHARGMTLTALGEAFINRMRVVQADIQRSRDEIDQLRGRPAGQVSIGLSMVATIALFPNLLEKFKGRFPDVRLTVMEGLFPDLRSRIIDGTLDFYVGPITERPIPRELAVETLLNGNLVILARKGHPLRAVRSLSALAEASWVCMSLANVRGQELECYFEEQGLPPPRIGIDVNSALSAFMVAAHSDLLLLMPYQFTRHPGADKFLERIKIRETLEAPAIQLATRSRLPLTPAAEFMADLVRRAALHEGQRSRQAPPAQPSE
jgi:LysR family transcriptional regulator, regulator of abg operon